jgi:hypothetical protein
LTTRLPSALNLFFATKNTANKSTAYGIEFLAKTTTSPYIDVMAASYTLTIEQGATLRRSFIYKTGTTEANATPFDLTNYTARSQVRPTYASTTLWAEWTTSNGGLTLFGATGRIDLFSSATLTTNMPAASGVWDLELVSPTGEVIRMLEGPAVITPEVTR